MERSSVPGGAGDERADPVGVVVVGTGGIANAHLAALRGSVRARLAGVVDTNRQRAQSASLANGGAPWTTSLDEALAWPDCDAVVVCTPNDSHAPIALRVADAGKHLLMEKPLAVTVADAVAVRDAFEAVGRSLAVAHTHRAYDYSRGVKQVIDRGDIGTPQVIRLSFLATWLWGDWRAWVLDPARSGSHPLHNGVHLLDTVTWWMGERPHTVYARGRRQTATELQIDDYIEMTLSYSGGRFAVCEMSRAQSPRRLSQRDVLVLGDRGTIAQPPGGDASDVFEESGTTALTALASDAFARQLDGWLDAIAGGTALAGPADGVFSVAMAVAADQSIRTGEPVAIADVLGGATQDIAKAGVR